MTDLRRLPAGDLVIDLRSTSPAQIDDASAFEALAERLVGMDGQVRLRIWVLHDTVAQWCDAPAVLEQNLRTWLTAAHAQVLASDGSDCVVLPPAAVRDERIVAVIQGLGLPVYRTRHGGGLPVETVHFDGQPYTAMTSPALALVPLDDALREAVERALG